MASSLKSNKPNTTRSISLPCRSHPSTFKVKEELNKLNTWKAEALPVPTADTISNGLSRLQELYKCTDDLLNLPLTKQALPHHQHKEWINELLDGSVRFLDICGSTREAMSQIKEHARELRSTLRRRKGDLSIEISIAKYVSFRKKIKKDGKKLIAALKQVDKKNGGLPYTDLDHHLSAVIRILGEVNDVTISVFQNALLFFSTSFFKPEGTKWSLVSRLMPKGTVACEDQHNNNVNELERVGAPISIFGSSKGQNIPIAQQRLEALEARVEGIENGLEFIFRYLIRTRASLLNIVSL